MVLRRKDMFSREGGGESRVGGRIGYGGMARTRAYKLTVSKSGSVLKKTGHSSVRLGAARNCMVSRFVGGGRGRGEGGREGGREGQERENGCHW